MSRRLPLRRSIPVVGAGIALAGFGAATLAGAFTPSGAGARAAVAPAVAAVPAQAPNPYFLCVAYQGLWGVCVGPPTN